MAAQRGVALVMLFLVGTINFVDRQLLSVLVEPIRAELHLTDTQFGLLTGLAFALFYAGMGVPVAYLADRWNRVRLIAAAGILTSKRSRLMTRRLDVAGDSMGTTRGATRSSWMVLVIEIRVLN